MRKHNDMTKWVGVFLCLVVVSVVIGVWHRYETLMNGTSVGTSVKSATFADLSPIVQQTLKFIPKHQKTTLMADVETMTGYASWSGKSSVPGSITTKLQSPNITDMIWIVRNRNYLNGHRNGRQLKFTFAIRKNDFQVSEVNTNALTAVTGYGEVTAIKASKH